MWIFIPPPGAGPTVGDLIDAFENFTWKEGVILVICLCLGWVSTYFVLQHFYGPNTWGLKTVSFEIGWFVGLLYFVIVHMVKIIIAGLAWRKHE